MIGSYASMVRAQAERTPNGVEVMLNSSEIGNVNMNQALGSDLEP